MGTLAAGFMTMRWEFFSAVMMFFASTMNVVCRNSSRNALAFIFSGVGISMACWFVTGLLGITLSFEISWHHLWANTKETIIYVLENTPMDWQII